jgi:hypothetical protein
MSILAALVAGFVIGTKAGGEEWDQVRQSLVALYGSEEFADVVTATRAQVAKTLRVVAQMVDAEPEEVHDTDVVARVRHLIARDN